MQRFQLKLLVSISVIILSLFALGQLNSTERKDSPPIVLKDVGEPQYEHFGLTDSDFRQIHEAGFTVISVNFDLCADDKDVEYYLDTAHKYNLKVILPAGSGATEWGYACDDMPSSTQPPVWQKEKVQSWIKKWKDYPAVWGWDSSNEDGENLPNGSNNSAVNSLWVKYALTPYQLKTAYQDIKAVDPIHPVMIRMNGFWFYERESDFFQPGNHFEAGVADIVMVNAYSNIFETYEPSFVSETLGKADASIHAVDPNVTIIPSLAAWKELPDWNLPIADNLNADYNQAINTVHHLAGMAYFKYGAPEGEDWHLPDPTRGSQDLWQILKQLNRDIVKRRILSN